MIAGARRWSLRTRMVGLFTALLVAIGVFMLAFFPSRMADQARASAEQRAAAIAQVMSTGLGPAIEFDDADNAATILAWLATTPDARFGVARRADGSQIAAWHAAAIPRGQRWPNQRQLQVDGELLIATVPIVGLAGGSGHLHVGFSLHALAQERARTTRTVAEATAVVLVAGVLATLALASWLLRPIRRLTWIARGIARGELPPELPAPSGAAEVAQMAEALRVMLVQLNQVNQQLLTASRHAGMAEIATGVLHNVGNVLTSVNVSVELVHERLRELPIARLGRLEQLLAGMARDGGPEPPRLDAATRYVAAISELLGQARDSSLRDLDGLRGHLEHIKRVVAMQNAYARRGGVVEAVTLRAIATAAVELGCPEDRRRGITVAVDAPETVVLLDRHGVLQIAVNLVSNARDAVAGQTEARIAVTARIADGALQLEVADSGVGIAAGMLERIFAAGFTTKPHGHGYGLHSSAIAAHQLGGALVAASPGPGQGARFTLRVPIAVPGAGHAA